MSVVSGSGQLLHERARSLLSLIDGLHIENDLSSARRTIDDWRTEMLSLVNSIHLSTSNKLDSLTGRLAQFKQHRSATMRQDILPNLAKMVVERRKLLSEQELNEIKAKLTKIDSDLQTFGRTLKKVGNDEKKLVEQVEILKTIQRDNMQLSSLDLPSKSVRRFALDSCHSPFMAISEHNHMLIEDDNHLVLFDEQRRLNEIPWQERNATSSFGSLKDLMYSSYLGQFCVLSALNFFTLDPQTSALEKSEQLRPSTGSHFQSIACIPNTSDIFVALLTSASRTNIERWSLMSGSLIKRWYYDIFESDDRVISCIRANETCLAACIKQQSQQNNSSGGSWRVDLFDFSLVRMCRGINLKIGGLGTYTIPFDERSWLVINGNDIWLLGEQGECVEQKTFDSRDQLHNIIVKDADTNGTRQFILKMGKPAELRIVDM